MCQSKMGADNEKMELAKFVAFVLFGMGSWGSLLGLYSELPSITQHAPEKSDLPTYLLIVQQVANVFPVCIVIFYSNKLGARVIFVLCLIIYILTLVGCLMLAFLWNTHISNHSIPLLIITFMLGGTTSSSNVAFFPFISNFPKVYTSSFLIGLGLSSALMSALAIVQGAKKDPDFTVMEYFLVVTFIMFLSMLAFLWLARQAAAAAAAKQGSKGAGGAAQDAESGGAGAGSVSAEEAVMPSADSSLNTRLIQVEDGGAPQFKGDGGGNKAAEGEEEDDETEEGEGATGGAGGAGAGSGALTSAAVRNVSAWRLVSAPVTFPYFLTIVWSGFLTYGMVPSVLPFASTAYAGGSQVYLYASVAGYCSDLLARVVTLAPSVRAALLASVHRPLALLLLATCAFFALFFLACMSPHPLLVESAAYGPALPILAAGVFNFFSAATNVAVFLHLHALPWSEDFKAFCGSRKKRDLGYFGTKMYQLAGLGSQVGSTAGSIVSFLLVVVFKVLADPTK